MRSVVLTYAFRNKKSSKYILRDSFLSVFYVKTRSCASISNFYRELATTGLLIIDKCLYKLPASYMTTVNYNRIKIKHYEYMSHSLGQNGERKEIRKTQTH